MRMIGRLAVVAVAALLLLVAIAGTSVVAIDRPPEEDTPGGVT